MLTNRAVLWMIGLTIAVAAQVGCVPHSLPEVTATIQPTGTIIPTATATAADTPTLPPTKTEAPSLTPTPEGGDYSQAFFDPQSEADLSKVIDAPALDDPNRAQWEDGYLTAVNERLKTYSGPVFTLDGAGIDFGDKCIVFQAPNGEPTEIGVLSSYKFKWNGETVVAKTFVLKLDDGSLLPFSVAFSNHDPKNPNGLKTPSGKNVLYTDFDNIVTPAQVADPFKESYFAALNKPGDFDGWRRVLAGKGTDQDKFRFSRTPFVLWTILDQ